MNIQLNDVRQESRKRFYESKAKEYLTTGNVEKIKFGQAMEESQTFIVGDSMLAGIEEKTYIRK